MKEKINVKELHKAIKEQIEKTSNIKVYDTVETSYKPPFMYLQFVNKKDSSTKTMYVEDFTFYIHSICDGKSSIYVYDLIQKIEEALTEDILLDKKYNVLEQIEDGIINLVDEEETLNKHAVISYTFRICYGFKCKV